MKTVKVYIVGGTVQDVDVPPGVAVEIYDYDVEGCDEDRLGKDKDGNECMIAVWEP